MDQSSASSSTTFYKRFTALEKQVSILSAAPPPCVPTSVAPVSATTPDETVYCATTVPAPS